MSMRPAATRRRVTLAVVHDAAPPAAPVLAHDKRLTDTLALLRGHVTFWGQREQLPALDDYLDKVGTRKATGSLPQYKEFSGAVRMAAVILCARPAAAVALPGPEPERELWRCGGCGRMFDEAGVEHECVPALPVAEVAPETGEWRLLDRPAAPGEAHGEQGSPPEDPPGPDTPGLPPTGPGAPGEDEPGEVTP